MLKYQAEKRTPKGRNWHMLINIKSNGLEPQCSFLLGLNISSYWTQRQSQLQEFWCTLVSATAIAININMNINILFIYFVIPSPHEVLLLLFPTLVIKSDMKTFYYQLCNV